MEMIPWNCQKVQVKVGLAMLLLLLCLWLLFLPPWRCGAPAQKSRAAHVASEEGLEGDPGVQVVLETQRMVILALVLLVVAYLSQTLELFRRHSWLRVVWVFGTTRHLLKLQRLCGQLCWPLSRRPASLPFLIRHPFLPFLLPSLPEPVQALLREGAPCEAAHHWPGLEGAPDEAVRPRPGSGGAPRGAGDPSQQWRGVPHFAAAAVVAVLAAVVR